MSEYYDFVLPIVLEAGKILRDAKTIEGRTKGNLDCDWVTIYDIQIEELLIKQLQTKYPEHKFIGEETFSTLSLTDDPTWFIDPIDGTENFMRKLKLSCISVALVINKIQILGIVYNPFIDELFTAIKGQGAFLNGDRIYVTQQTQLDQSFFNYELGIARINEDFYNLYMFRLKYLISKVMSFRSFGSAALGLCYVACGRTDAYQCDGLSPWDAAAGTLILTEAGGYVVDSSGINFDLMRPNFLACSTKELADQYLIVEREADKERTDLLNQGKVFVP